MTSIKERTDAFIQLGNFFRLYDENLPKSTCLLKEIYFEAFEKEIEQAHIYNAWFTPEFVRSAIVSLGLMLQEQSINDWIKSYEILDNPKTIKKVGVIMAGNIPMVNFHDLFCVVMSGHIFIGKLSSKDNSLMQMVAKMLFELQPVLKNAILFIDGMMPEIDAIIATGSNNTARYFEQYFAKYPNIIRKNRSSIAILDGSETNEELKELAKDIFMYFGMGCRNISKVFLPKDSDPSKLYPYFKPYEYLYSHNKYANNHDYHRSVYLLSALPHLDNGFLIMKEDTANTSPVAVLYFEYYSEIQKLIDTIEKNIDQIQCVVTKNNYFKVSIGFGNTQVPSLFDYPDGIDVMNFLLKI